MLIIGLILLLVCESNKIGGGIKTELISIDHKQFKDRYMLNTC